MIGNTDLEIMAEAGRRLKAWRLQLNLTVADVAARAGLNRNTVVNAEAGKNPRLATIVGLLRVYGRLESLDAFLPPPTVSPLALLESRGRRPRARASRRPRPGSRG